MTSPLLPYANGYLLIAQQGTPSVVQGRITQTPGTNYLVQCYLKRQDSAGTSTGADYMPLQSGSSNGLTGAGGQIYLYRGYALRYASVGSSYNLDTLSLSGLTFAEFNVTNVPSWLRAGIEARHRQGAEKSAYCIIETASGKFGNDAIDDLINENIGGIPLVIRSGQVLN
jgi:hypothetical protein